MRKFQHLIQSLFLALSIPAALAAPQNAEPIKVGMELAYPPFEMTNLKNQPSGISVEMAIALSAYLNRPLQLINMSYDGLIPSLKTGKIDVIISSMTVTDERKKSIDFSDAYVKTGLAILANIKSDIKSVKDLDKKNIKVAVKKGTTGHIWATKNLKNAKILLLDKENNAVLEVSQGKADAFLYDQMSVYRNWKQNAATTKAILNAFQQEQWAIGLKRDQKELKNKINAFLKEYKSRGNFDKLAEKYFAEEKKTFKTMGVGFIF